jgi:hypothetical protein
MSQPYIPSQWDDHAELQPIVSDLVQGNVFDECNQERLLGKGDAAPARAEKV